MFKFLLNYISFFMRNAFGKIVGYIIGLVVPRSSKIILLTCSPFKKDKFLHNSKYLYLYLKNNTNEYKSVWICNSKKMQKDLKSKGFSNIYTSNSLQGIFYILRAKYWFSDYQFADTCKKYLYGSSVRINLWHGIPLKKIQFDDNSSYGFYHKLNKFSKKIYDALRFKDSYYIVNGKHEQECYKTGFLTSEDKMPILGSPRLDVLLNDIKDAEVFMEEDFNAIQQIKEQGKKIFIYMPTFRDTGKDISLWLKSKKLKQFLRENNSVLVCKLHPYDKNGLNFEDCDELYKMNNNSDIYPVLKYSDALITDYSSVYFDYLLLDKPIIYYLIDLKEYESTRGFYAPYEELTAGIKAYTEEELICAMQDVIDGIDNYKEQRIVLRDKIFKYQDGKNCERVVGWIKSLEEKGK